jgi:hypothetical protein
MSYLRNPKWWDAALTRAIKTAAEVFVATIGTNTVAITDLDWPTIVGLAGTSAVLSLCVSLAGLPEVDEE